MQYQNPDMPFSADIYNQALILIENVCLNMVNKRLLQLGLDAPTRSSIVAFDRDMNRETEFDIDELRSFVDANLPKLTPE